MMPEEGDLLMRELEIFLRLTISFLWKAKKVTDAHSLRSTGFGENRTRREPFSGVLTVLALAPARWCFFPEPRLGEGRVMLNS